MVFASFITHIIVKVVVRSRQEFNVRSKIIIEYFGRKRREGCIISCIAKNLLEY